MDTLVFLLRGINVGGSGRLPMTTLRGVAEGLGLSDVRTYIHSGNILARTDRPPEEAAQELTSAIEATVGFAPDVIVRTAAELRATVQSSPFPLERLDPKLVHVTFLEEDAAPSLDGFEVERFAPEQVVAVGRELHLHLPGGIGRSPLATALARHGSPATSTTRGWRTVTRLANRADEVASGADSEG